MLQADDVARPGEGSSLFGQAIGVLLAIGAIALLARDLMH